MNDNEKKLLRTRNINNFVQVDTERKKHVYRVALFTYISYGKLPENLIVWKFPGTPQKNTANLF